MSNLDTLTYFVGAAVLCAVFGAALVAFLACIYGLIAIGFAHWSKKVFNGVKNWQAVYQWNENGRPQWKCGKDRVYRMVPSAGPYEKEEGDE